jgi:hypothetical protein
MTPGPPHPLGIVGAEMDGDVPDTFLTLYRLL